MEDYGMKIAVQGKNILDGLEDYEYVFNSGFDILKVSESGTMSGGTSKSHGIGYNPIFFANERGIGTNNRSLPVGAASDNFYVTDTTLYSSVNCQFFLFLFPTGI